MSATLAVRPNRIAAGSPFPQPPVRRLGPPAHIRKLSEKIEPWRGLIIPSRWLTLANNNKTMVVVRAGSRADDSSAPYEMSVENALKLLGVSEGASFEDILRAKNSILATCKDDKDTIAQVRFTFLLVRTGLVPISMFLDVSYWFHCCFLYISCSFFFNFFLFVIIIFLIFFGFSFHVGFSWIGNFVEEFLMGALEVFDFNFLICGCTRIQVVFCGFSFQIWRLWALLNNVWFLATKVPNFIMLILCHM